MYQNEAYEKGLRSRVMRQVLLVHRVRQVVTPLTVKAAFLFALGLVGSAFVSVQNVIANMPAVYEVRQVSDFVLSAFLNTEFIVQALLIAAGLFAVFMLRDIVRNIGAPRHLYSRAR